jgi:hypothetical protein
VHSFIAPKLRNDHRCKHPDFANDTFSISPLFDALYTNVTSLSKCDYMLGNATKVKCDSWVFDHTYYQKTLTEEVKKKKNI